MSKDKKQNKQANKKNNLKTKVCHVTVESDSFGCAEELLRQWGSSNLFAETELSWAEWAPHSVTWLFQVINSAIKDIKVCLMDVWNCLPYLITAKAEVMALGLPGPLLRHISGTDRHNTFNLSLLI